MIRSFIDPEHPNWGWGWRGRLQSGHVSQDQPSPKPWQAVLPNTMPCSYGKKAREVPGWGLKMAGDLRNLLTGPGKRSPSWGGTGPPWGRLGANCRDWWSGTFVPNFPGTSPGIPWPLLMAPQSCSCSPQSQMPLCFVPRENLIEWDPVWKPVGD